MATIRVHLITGHTATNTTRGVLFGDARISEQIAGVEGLPDPVHGSINVVVSDGITHTFLMIYNVQGVEIQLRVVTEHCGGELAGKKTTLACKFNGRP